MDDALSQEELNAVRKLAFSGNDYDPFALSVISIEVLRRLISSGLAEKGCSCRPAVAPIGFRLTDKGWRIASKYWTSSWHTPAAPHGNGHASRTRGNHWNSDGHLPAFGQVESDVRPHIGVQFRRQTAIVAENSQ